MGPTNECGQIQILVWTTFQGKSKVNPASTRIKSTPTWFQMIHSVTARTRNYQPKIVIEASESTSEHWDFDSQCVDLLHWNAQIFTIRNTLVNSKPIFFYFLLFWIVCKWCRRAIRYIKHWIFRLTTLELWLDDFFLFSLFLLKQKRVTKIRWN